jgi:hypothetical protein
MLINDDIVRLDRYGKGGLISKHFGVVTRSSANVAIDEIEWKDVDAIETE